MIACAWGSWNTGHMYQDLLSNNPKLGLLESSTGGVGGQGSRPPAGTSEPHTLFKSSF